MATMQKLHAKATHVTLIGHFWESAMEYRHRGETWMGFRGHRFVVDFCAEKAHATFPLSAQDSNYRRNCRRRRPMVSASFSWTRELFNNECVCAGSSPTRTSHQRSSRTRADLRIWLKAIPSTRQHAQRPKRETHVRTSDVVQAFFGRCKKLRDDTSFFPLVTIHMFGHADNVIAHGLCFRVTWHARACFDPNGQHCGKLAKQLVVPKRNRVASIDKIFEKSNQQGLPNAEI